MLKAMFIQKVTGTIVRAGLVATGTWLVNEGHASAAEFETLQGAALIAVGVVHSIWEKRDRLLG